jgi:hypothetical protein
MDSLKQSKFLLSLDNVLSTGYHVKIEDSQITVIITDRLLGEVELMQLFEVMFIYGYKERKLAYANLKHIAENPVGEVFTFVEK